MQKNMSLDFGACLGGVEVQFICTAFKLFSHYVRVVKIFERKDSM